MLYIFQVRILCFFVLLQNQTMWFPYWFHPTFSKWTPWYVVLVTVYWINHRVYLKQLCGNLTPSFTTQIQTGLPLCLTCNVTKHLSSSHTYSLCHHTKLCSVNLNHQQQRSHKYQSLSMVQFLCVLAFDFCRFCVVIRFFINGQWPPTLKDFYPRFYPLHLFPALDASTLPLGYRGGSGIAQ